MDIISNEYLNKLRYLWIIAKNKTSDSTEIKNIIKNLVNHTKINRNNASKLSEYIYDELNGFEDQYSSVIIVIYLVENLYILNKKLKKDM